MPLKKSTRSKTTASPDAASGAAKATRSKKPAGLKSVGPGAIVLIVMCVAAAVILLAARETSDPVESEAAAISPAASSAPAEIKKTAPSRSTSPAAARSRAVAADVTPAAATEPPPAPSKAVSATVTIAGCLERADEGFRLKDTSGDDAPRARSWKSGFLKKGSATIAVVDAGNALRLGDHVGERVTATGTLIDRQMLVHSLRRVAASCK